MSGRRPVQKLTVGAMVALLGWTAASLFAPITTSKGTTSTVWWAAPWPAWLAAFATLNFLTTWVVLRSTHATPIPDTAHAEVTLMTDPNPASLPCICCGKALEDACGPDQTHNQPYGGTMFRSSGNYGSTVFDPVGSGEVLDVNICDECLVAGAKEGRVAYARTLTVVERTHEALWTGPMHGEEG